MKRTTLSFFFQLMIVGRKTWNTVYKEIRTRCNCAVYCRRQKVPLCHFDKHKVYLYVPLAIYATVETNNRLNLVLRQCNKKELIKIKAFCSRCRLLRLFIIFSLYVQLYSFYRWFLTFDCYSTLLLLKFSISFA